MPRTIGPSRASTRALPHRATLSPSATESAPRAHGWIRGSQQEVLVDQMHDLVNINYVRFPERLL